MKKCHYKSRIEIWNIMEVNNPDLRLPENKDVIILQIEKGQGEDYIVEIVNTENYMED